MHPGALGADDGMGDVKAQRTQLKLHPYGRWERETAKGRLMTAGPSIWLESVCR